MFVTALIGINLLEMGAELLVALAIILMVIGLIGSVLPILPGAPIAWVGLLVFKLSNYSNFSWIWVICFGVLALLGIVLDYVLPAYGTKKMGGSKWGIWGTTIGLVLGIIFPVFGPFTIFIAPFIGALAAELIHNYKDTKRAFKAALGSFLGFVSTTGYGILLSASMLIFTVWILLENLF